MSEVFVHRFDGCRTRPLASYLKALGVFRLLAEQKDQSVRGWWREDTFHIATSCSESELINFFENEFQPTAMTAPWLSRSGYGKGSNHSKTRKFLKPLVESEIPQLAKFRAAFALGVELAREFQASLENPDLFRNVAFVEAFRSRTVGAERDWIDSSVVSHEADVLKPAVFGTGGNEFSGSYLANFYVALHACVVKKLGDVTASLFDKCLGSTATTSYLIHSNQNFSSGHFDVGTTNAAPWDYVLAVEGVVMLASKLTRRIDCQSMGKPPGSSAALASPFSTGNTTAGYPSECLVDSKTFDKGRPLNGRGEQWFPVWSSPSELNEVTNLFRVGKANSAGKGAQSALCFARGVSRMGVERGIEAFERVGYFQRNGKNHMAVGVGRFEVRGDETQRVIDELVPWIKSFESWAKRKNAPSVLEVFSQKLNSELLGCVRGTKRLLGLAELAANAESLLIQYSKHSKNSYATPIVRRSADDKHALLSNRWLRLLAEDSSEFRLAKALAFQLGKLNAKDRRATAVRTHWLPMNGLFFVNNCEAGPDQSARGKRLEAGLRSVVQRRLVAISRGGSDDGRFPLELSDQQHSAMPQDIQAFVERRTNDDRILSIARALMAIESRSGSTENDVSTQQVARQPLGGLAAYGIFKLAMAPRRVWMPDSASVTVRCNPAMFHRLASGDINSAARLAIQQMTAAGLRPRVRTLFGNPELARRLAAAMAFGVNDSTMTRLALGLTQPQLTNQERTEIADPR